MKIAVPVTRENQIDGHFGHCESYGVFTISDKNEIAEIKSFESPQGCGCKSDIASVLASDGVTVMLAGGIGGGAINVLNNSGIEVIRGCSGDATEVVKLYLSGLVEDSGSSCHQHEAHHQDGDPFMPPKLKQLKKAGSFRPSVYYFVLELRPGDDQN